MKSVEMSRALTAAMSLRLPGTAGKLANKMRYVDSKGPLFHDGGLIRNITQGKHDKIYAVGISSKSKSMPALGGMLYGAAALRHDLVVANNEVSEGLQDSRVDINDMNFLGASERLVWKEFILVYRLLSDLMSSDTKPDIIFVDIPLLVSRAEQSVFLEEEDVQEDWQALLKVMEEFWQRHLNDFYPNNPDGPFLVSLQTKRDLNSAVLNAIREEGQSGSPEAIDDKIVNLIREDWGQLRRVGILRFLKGTLKAGRRTAAFYYESLSKYMKRFEPKVVSEHGLVGFHLQVGLSNTARQVIVALISSELMKAAGDKSRPIRPCFIIYEEGHNFAPNGEPCISKNIIKRIAAEGRKFGVGFAIVSQRPSKLDSDVTSQCNTIVAMRIKNPDDQRFIQKTSDYFSAADLAELPTLSTGEALICGRAIIAPLVVKVGTKALVHGGESPKVCERWGKPEI